jgi:hypothetical protein
MGEILFLGQLNRQPILNIRKNCKLLPWRKQSNAGRMTPGLSWAAAAFATTQSLDHGRAVPGNNLCSPSVEGDRTHNI